MTKKNECKIVIKLFFIYITAFNYISKAYIISNIFNNEIINKHCYNNNNKDHTIFHKRHVLTLKLNSTALSPTHTTSSLWNNKTTDSGVNKNVKLKKKDKKILKKYKDFLDMLPNRNVEYGIIDAIEKIKTLAIHKFVESIDIYLSFNKKKSKMTKNDNIKTFITFPHNLKKKRKKIIYVVTNKNLYKAATESGADVVGEDDLINKIKEKEIRLKKKNNNFLLCTNDVIHKLTRVGKEVGSKGLMPNEKCGTLVSEYTLEKHVKMFKFENTLIFKLNKLNTLNLNVGDVYMSNDDIKENICHLFEFLDNLEFFHFNYKNLKSIYLGSTMGFPFKIKKNFY
ncbi:50S ribosomal protein L1, apicoplast, putative [Hepatocystis sp. ex Piliocolobus tephrosceles]|nr:50S ribosomal protein L1, apicoplast, putative [Hepatocystis sp. ex Piliocolobus tephrosceles]